MKKRFVTGIIGLACLSVFAVRAVRAQSAHSFDVEIPFPFVLGGQSLPAGKYELSRIDQAKPNLVMVRNANARMLRLLLTLRVQKETPSATTYLLFGRFGDQLYLSEIWIKGDMNGIRIPPMGQEERQDPSKGSPAVRLNLRKP